MGRLKWLIDTPKKVKSQKSKVKSQKAKGKRQKSKLSQ